MPRMIHFTEVPQIVNGAHPSHSPLTRLTVLKESGYYGDVSLRECCALAVSYTKPYTFYVSLVHALLSIGRSTSHEKIEGKIWPIEHGLVNPAYLN